MSARAHSVRFVITLESRVVYKGRLALKAEDYVREKLDYTSSQNKEGRIRGSVSGFINAAITNDYKTEKAAQKAAVKKRKQTAPDIAEERRRKEKEARAQRGVELSSWLDGLKPQHREIIRADFAATLDKDYLRADYTKHGLKAPLIIDRFAAYVETNSLVKERA